MQHRPCDTRLCSSRSNFIFMLRPTSAWHFSLSDTLSPSMICPLPEKFLTSFDMNRKFGGDLVSHPPGPGESEKWNQAEYQVRTCPPPPPAFEISDEQISGLRNRFCRPNWSGGQLSSSSSLATFEQALNTGALMEFIIPTCKVMHSNQHFLKSASSSLEGRGEEKWDIFRLVSSKHFD